MGNSPYRPPQWGQALGIQTLMLIFPGQPNAAQYNAEGVSVTLPSNQTVYVFDCVIRQDHDQSITKTMHPVQTGASISDHAYAEPAQLVIEIGMSDAMDAYQPGIWTGAATKSTSAFQILLAMSYARIPVVITTKLRTYQNMLITQITAEETNETFASLKARVRFGEIFMANTQSQANSARPQDTNATAQGSPAPTPPTAAQTNNNQVPSTINEILPQAANVLGAGQWCSVNCSNLPNLIPGG